MRILGAVNKSIYWENHMNPLDVRVEQLEKQMRWYRGALVLTVLALAAFVLTGATHSVPDIIRARKFEAVNAKGKVSAVMEAMKGHGDGLFRAYNRNGIEVFYAGSSRTGDGRIEIMSNKGKMNVELTGRK